MTYKNEADYWLMINNSSLQPEVIAEGDKTEINIVNINIWQKMREFYDKRV